MSNIDFANKVFHFHISERLDELRNSLCPVPGKYLCSVSCPVWKKYGGQGLSCNGALDKYPEDCIALLEVYKIEQTTKKLGETPSAQKEKYER